LTGPGGVGTVACRGTGVLMMVIEGLDYINELNRNFIEQGQDPGHVI